MKRNYLMQFLHFSADLRLEICFVPAMPRRKRVFLSPGSFWGRNHPHLWKTLADWGIFQDLQIISESGWRMPQSVLWCTDSPCGNCICQIYDAGSWAAERWRSPHSWGNLFLSDRWTGGYHIWRIPPDYTESDVRRNLYCFSGNRSTNRCIYWYLCRPAAEFYTEFVSQVSSIWLNCYFAACIVEFSRYWSHFGYGKF